jgi:hypothetical protein
MRRARAGEWSMTAEIHQMEWKPMQDGDFSASREMATASLCRIDIIRISIRDDQHGAHRRIRQWVERHRPHVVVQGQRRFMSCQFSSTWVTLGCACCF